MKVMMRTDAAGYNDAASTRLCGGAADWCHTWRRADLHHVHTCRSVTAPHTQSDCGDKLQHQTAASQLTSVTTAALWEGGCVRLSPGDRRVKAGRNGMRSNTDVEQEHTAGRIDCSAAVCSAGAHVTNMCCRYQRHAAEADLGSAEVLLL